jgi:hypothetical protein
MQCFIQRSRGLETQDLEANNTATLSKWLYKLLIEEGVWQNLMRRKYVGSKDVSKLY